MCHQGDKIYPGPWPKYILFTLAIINRYLWNGKNYTIKSTNYIIIICDLHVRVDFMVRFLWTFFPSRAKMSHEVHSSVSMRLDSSQIGGYSIS